MTSWLRIEHKSAVGAARRAARRAGMNCGLPESKLEPAAIVATEMANNILRHSGSGRMLVQVMEIDGQPLLAIAGMDKGPGISNLDLMMRDGESTLGSAGVGLGAMQRLSDQFDIHTSQERGTVVTCLFWPQEFKHVSGWDLAALKVNHPLEQVCGDDYMVRTRHNAVELLLCDGLGHGAKANEAASETLAAFARNLKTDAGEVLSDISQDISPTRGAVAAMVRLLRDAAKIEYAGVGNITTMVVGPERTKRFPVRDGRLGDGPLSPHQESLAIEQGDVLIVHSDGLSTVRNLEAEVALLRRSPLTIAVYLLNTHFRGRDDASIVVARRKQIAQ